MSSSDWNRRHFLKSSAAAAAGLELLFAGRTAVAESAKSLGPLESEKDFRRLAREYSLAKGLTYFNHGSIGTIPRAVSEARRRYLELCETNPWLYMWGGAWEEAREKTRGLAARAMGCASEETAIIHNTTEGFNLLAAGLPLKKGDEVLFSSLNHDGASVAFRHYGAAAGYQVRRFDFPLQDAPGMTSRDLVEIYAREIRPSTRLLVFPHLDNMVGLRHPLKELTEAVRSRGVEFVAVDGAQSLGMIPVNLSSSGVDFFAGSPHKWVQAPKGLGLLYVRLERQAQLRPLWVTWGQRRWGDSARRYEDYGTRNLPEVLALGDALEFQARLGQTAKADRYRRLRRHFRESVEQSRALTWLSPRRWKAGGSLYSVRAEGRSSREVFATLNPKGYVFRAFSGGDFEGCRISPNLFNSTQQIDRFVREVESLGGGR